MPKNQLSTEKVKWLEDIFHSVYAHIFSYEFWHSYLLFYTEDAHSELQYWPVFKTSKAIELLVIHFKTKHAENTMQISCKQCNIPFIAVGIIKVYF